MRIERFSDHFAHGAPALSAIELAAMMGLHSLWTARTGLDRFADAFVIDIAADANDHANDLQHVRMIVKNDSQLKLWTIGARNGWRDDPPLGNVCT